MIIQFTDPNTPTEKNANRMEVLAVQDLQEAEAVQLMRQARRKLFGTMMSVEEAKEIYDIVGGRPSVISSLAKRKVCAFISSRDTRLMSSLTGHACGC